jgi:hypothetical protein
MILFLRFFYWMLELFRQYDIYFFHFIICYEKNPAELQLLKKIWLWSSSVIKTVNMKYNRIDIKWRHVSTSFKIYLEMLSNFYITFTIFYYNTISLNPPPTKYFDTIINPLCSKQLLNLVLVEDCGGI